MLQHRYSLWFAAIVIRYKEFTRDLYKNMDGKTATLDHAGQFEAIESTLKLE